MIRLKSKIRKRGRVVIPKPIRDIFSLGAGEEISFRVEDEKIIIEVKDGEKVLQEYLSEIRKTKEPKDIDWDAEYYSQMGD